MHRTKQLFSQAVALLLIGALAACEPREGGREEGDPQAAAVVRMAADALDRRTADARKARLGSVEYDVLVDLAAAGEDYSGEVTLRFELSGAGGSPQADLTVDFGGGTVLDVDLNGQPAKASYNGFFITLPGDGLRAGPNTATIRYSHPYSEDGTGLHRFVDPVDGLTYLYTYLWPYYANRLAPLFDQPNLKARFTLTVHAPADWVVVSMAPGQAEPEPADGTATWRFTATPPMAPYAFSLHAGPYRVWEADADGVPLRLMARRSLADYVAVEEWFDVTRRGLGYYGEYFDIPYPFTKYDQLIVPDFAIGAMENIAAVAFSEQFVQRQASDRGEREARQSVILHEMAHMWFGNLVTHDWWNGLWLNESFASQMAAMAELETTEFTDAWHGFFTRRKQEAYRADSRVTTHPIEVPVESTADFFSVFDDITYDKGSSVLKQLAHNVGEDNYRRGVSEYLEAFEYRNSTLDDFIRYQANAAGMDLDAWARDWLYTPGFNTLRAAPRCEDGKLVALTIVQSAPASQPTLRQHVVDMALYAVDEKGLLQPAEVIPVTVEGVETPVALPGDTPCPALINPNHGDWTLAQIELDPRSLETLGEQLGQVPEPLSRSMFLAALFHRAIAGDTPLADYLGQAIRLAEGEQNIRVQQQLSASLVATAHLMQRLRPETDAALARWLPILEERSLAHAAAASAGDLKRIWFSTFAGVAATEAGVATMLELLDGSRQITGLPIAQDLRWLLLTRLAGVGLPETDALLEAERARDASDFGMKSALTARAALPERGRKEHWLAELHSPESLTGLARQRAVMGGLFPAAQTGLQVDLLDDILAPLPQLSHRVDPYFMSSYVSLLLQPMCLPESVARLQSTLDAHSERLDTTALRFLREAHQADAECSALRDLQ